MDLCPSEALDWEQRRLSALQSYDVLDSPREQQFDEIARLASDICATPIAVVNLIGASRQFFKAEVGLGVRETPFESSFCAKAILEEDFLLVPDATKDQRFDGNPLVTGGPLVAEPLRKGFGSRLIRMGIVGTADVDKSYLPTGLVAVFRAPLGLVREVG